MKKIMKLLLLSLVLFGCRQEDVTQEKLVADLKKDPLFESYIVSSLARLDVLSSPENYDSLINAKKDGKLKEYLKTKRTSNDVSFNQSAKDNFYYFTKLKNKYVRQKGLAYQTFRKVYMDEIKLRLNTRTIFPEKNNNK